jgi:hypothetical protein
LKRLSILGLAAILGLSSVGRAGQPVRFGRDILPILSENCFKCHGPDEKARKAKLRLDTHEGALKVIVPGKAAASELVRRINAAPGDGHMPPARSNRTLTAEQKALLKRWIDQGGAWGKHWAYEPPQRPDLPAVKNAGWVRNAIDRFVLARLEKEGLAPTPEADKATLLRRVTLDLTGLPPTLEEIDAFLADETPGAYERVVDRLLASPRYGERMAAAWLDGARYADTNGYQNDFARTMWPWRDWVIDAFNANMPFDRFTIEQIAGDLLPHPTLRQRIATGFNRNNRTVTEAGSIDDEWRVENNVDRVETTSTVFLGLTMGCCRCHDHKYDPLKQTEFYEFFAFFNNINEKGVYTEQRGNVPPLVAVPTRGDKERLRQFDAAVAAAEKAVRDQEAGLAERQKRWEQERKTAATPPEPHDWALRFPLDGSARAEVAAGQEPDAVYRGEGAPVWDDGPLGKALRLDGRDNSFLDAGQAFRPERTEAFSYGGWLKAHGQGTLLSKMDDAAAFRGFDLLLVDEGIAVHLIHSWPHNAIKVVARAAWAKDTWTHVLVTYDGSGKAAGVALYVNGKRAPLAVEADSLRGTIATSQPLRLGKRSTAFALNGELADVRFYRRALTTKEAEAIALRPVDLIVALPEARRTPAQRDFLARAFRERYAAGLVSAQQALAKAREARAEYEKRIPTVMVMEELPTPRDTFLLKRGRYDMPDRTRKVRPDVPSCLGSLPAGAPHNRLGLARWLVDPDNPLTARVAVNHYWEHYFGTGLVKTAENFGVQGEPPSHPALLDWLAVEFVRSGWDVKAMQRLIVTSNTYRQASTAPPALLQRDPDNRLLARGPRFRLSAEMVRDNALAVAGLLTEQVGGPSVKPYQPAGLWEELAGGAGEGPYVQDKGPNLYRRSLYIYRKRTVPHPLLATFDAPSREICTVRRSRTDTPLQALELLNDVTYVEAARHLAERMLAEGGVTPAQRLAFAFRRATGRPPGPAELAVLLRGLERYERQFRADSESARRYVHQGDSPVDGRLDPADLAAYTATAEVILNLDETITKE